MNLNAAETSVILNEYRLIALVLFQVAYNKEISVFILIKYGGIITKSSQSKWIEIDESSGGKF